LYSTCNRFIFHIYFLTGNVENIIVGGFFLAVNKFYSWISLKGEFRKSMFQK